jgi:hypothetical protein
MSDFDLYILKKYLFIPLLVLCIPILGAQLCSVSSVGKIRVSPCYPHLGKELSQEVRSEVWGLF